MDTAGISGGQARVAARQRFALCRFMGCPSAQIEGLLRHEIMNSQELGKLIAHSE